MTKNITTTEDWYPTIDGQVRVRLIILPATGGWRVLVWGGDDFGLERDFPPNEKQDAKVLYNRLTDGTTQAQMKSMGMTNG